MVVKSDSPAVENFNPNEAISGWRVNKFLLLHKLVILEWKLSVFYNMKKLLIDRLHHQGEKGNQTLEELRRIVGMQKQSSRNRLLKEGENKMKQQGSMLEKALWKNKEKRGERY